MTLEHRESDRPPGSARTRARAAGWAGAGVLPVGMTVAAAIVWAAASGGSLARAASSAGSPSAVSPQVWALVHVVDHKESGQDVHVQVPLLWLRGHSWSYSCRDADPAQSLDGTKLYENYHALPLGEETVVRDLRCRDFDLTLSVAAREALQGKGAGKLRVRIQGLGTGEDEGHIDVSLPFSALRTLGALFGDQLAGLGSSAEREAVMDSLEANVHLLKSMPAFELVRVRGKLGTVVVRTE